MTIDGYLRLLKNADIEDDDVFHEILLLTGSCIGMSDSDLAIYLMISKPTVVRWKSGEFTPHPLMRKGIYVAISEFVIKKTRV